MLTPDEQQQAQRLYEIRDELLELIEHHEETCKCGEFAVGTVAYLAHCVGVKTTNQINAMERELIQYNCECPNCTSRN